jgi:hypothetical protein
MIYDEVLIGTGLCIYSYVLGISKRKSNKSKKILCLSTDKISSINQNGHPKLFDKNYKIVDNYYNARFGPTSSLGGLSLAWGGVLYKPSKNYLMGRDLELINSTAIEILKNLSLRFKIYTKKNLNWEIYNHKDSRELENFYLVTSGSPYGWECSGLNIFPAIDELFNKLDIRLSVNKVIKIKYDEKLEIWNIHTTDLIINSRKVILGAGGLGNLEIINNSFHSNLSIKDHVPLQFFAFSIPFFQLINFSNKSTPICNVIYFNEDVASVYSLGDLSLNFRKKIISKWIAFKNIIPKMLGSIIFVQYWTNNSYAVIAKNKRNIKIYSNILSGAFNLIKIGILPFYFKFTKSGEGFHYSAPFDINNGELYNNTCKNLIILGGFASSEIKPEHPTFSFMIDSYIKGTNN